MVGYTFYAIYCNLYSKQITRHFNCLSEYVITYLLLQECPFPWCPQPKGFFKTYSLYSLYIFPPENRLSTQTVCQLYQFCLHLHLTNMKCLSLFDDMKYATSIRLSFITRKLYIITPLLFTDVFLKAR